MESADIGVVVEALLASTDRLAPAGARLLDVDKIEKALSEREHCVRTLSELARRFPEAFTLRDLEKIRHSLHAGRAALEKIGDLRRDGWVTATEMSRTQYLLRTISTFGTADPD